MNEWFTQKKLLSYRGLELKMSCGGSSFFADQLKWQFRAIANSVNLKNQYAVHFPLNRSKEKALYYGTTHNLPSHFSVLCASDFLSIDSGCFSNHPCLTIIL